MCWIGVGLVRTVSGQRDAGWTVAQVALHRDAQPVLAEFRGRGVTRSTEFTAHRRNERVVALVHAGVLRGALIALGRAGRASAGRRL